MSSAANGVISFFFLRKLRNFSVQFLPYSFFNFMLSRFSIFFPIPNSILQFSLHFEVIIYI